MLKIELVVLKVGRFWKENRLGKHSRVRRNFGKLISKE